VTKLQFKKSQLKSVLTPKTHVVMRQTQSNLSASIFSTCFCTYIEGARCFTHKSG